MFKVLDGLCTSSQPTPHPKSSPTQYWFSSSCKPCFTDLAKLWYTEVNGSRVKVLPSHEYLVQYFIEVSLAFLIMGDGYWEKEYKTVYICTDNFTEAEVLRFIYFLDTLFALKSTVKRRIANGTTRYRVRFSGIDTNLHKLRSMVSPHKHPLMTYKLGLVDKL